MKKTYNINIAGQAFIIDEEAFETLNQYLEALKKKFSNQQERDEILSDIESRIAEMLNQKLNDRKEVVGLADVNEIISTMGKPEDIVGEGADSSNSSTENNQTTFTAGNATEPKKRLFRDPDDAKIGGVI